MFQLDDKFLQDIGLGTMPQDQKQAFLEHIYNELELRVGTRLSEGLSEAQMSEFEAFIDRKQEVVEQWFSNHVPNYKNEQDYQKFAANAPETATELDIACEYGSLKWLEVNRPDYKQVVADELERLKQEIIQNRDTLLGGGAEGQQ